MAKTVVGLFDSFDEAQNVVRDLTDSGFSRDEISVVANDAEGRGQSMGGHDKMNDTAAEQAGSGAVAGTGVGAALGLLVGLGALAIPGIGPVLAAGPLATALGAGAATVAGSTALGAGIGAASGALVGPLVDAGIPRPEAEMYNEGVRRGGTLVMVRADDNMADQAADIMSRYNVVDIDERNEEFRSSGYTGYDENAQPYTSDDMSRFRSNTTNFTSTTGTTGTMDTSSTMGTSRTLDNNDQEVLPVVEEQLQVGKRQVQRGRARVHTKITETPVEEQVTLREEHLNVERRPVNRPVTDADNLFRDQSFEVTETAEEAVVAKQARVIEEVVVNKEVNERTETIRDTVRRQDVHVHEGDAATSATSARAVGTSGFESYDTDFRNHYNQYYASSGQDYNSYGPVYRYGYNLANDANYRDRNWNDIETDVRTRWEERNPGTWEQFKDGVRHAWEKSRGQR